MELGIWGTLWANCSFGTYFALPTMPIVPPQSEEELNENYDFPTHKDHETQTIDFSDSDEDDEHYLQDPNSEKEDEDEEEGEAEINVGDSITNIPNNSLTSDSSNLSSGERDHLKQNDDHKIMIVNKEKKRRSYQRNRYHREEYRCMACPYYCTTERAFLRHLRVHSDIEGKDGRQANQNMLLRVSCPVCGKDRKTNPALNKHMQRHKDKNKNFCCDICCFKTVQLKKLIQHRRMHTGERPHLCPHCVYRAARRDNLRSHVRRVHKRDNLTGDTFNPRGMLLVPSTKDYLPLGLKIDEKIIKKNNN